jgi:hypothetical protein
LECETVFQSWNSSAPTRPGALERRRGRCKRHGIASPNAGANGKRIGAVKDVTGAGGIDGVDRRGRLATDNIVRKPCDAIGAARDRSHGAAVVCDPGQGTIIG